MFGRAEILLEKLIKNLSIPSSCLAQRNGKGEGAVFVVKNGELHRVPVRVGLDNGLRVEVTSGLNETDQVVLGPMRPSPREQRFRSSTSKLGDRVDRAMGSSRLFYEETWMSAAVRMIARMEGRAMSRKTGTPACRRGLSRLENRLRVKCDHSG